MSCSYPTEFPAAAAIAVGRAIMSKNLTRANALDAWCLQGYLQGVLLGAGPAPKPVVGQGAVNDPDQLAALLVQAGVDANAHNVGQEPRENPEALPVVPILRLILRLLANLI